MAISLECQVEKHDDCPELLGIELGKCGCKCHLNTLEVSGPMDDALKTGLDEQAKIEPITPNPPHIS